MLNINILDLFIIFILIVGTIIGFSRGMIKSIVEFSSLLIAFVISYFIKNPVSIFLYKHLPFFNIKGITILNILIYEALAFLICLTLLMVLVKLILKISKILDKIIKSTIILNLPSRLIGAIFGFFQSYLIIFIILFIICQLNFNNNLVNNSKLHHIILKNTPIINNLSYEVYNNINEIYKIIKKYNNKEKTNFEIIKVMLNNKMISENNLKYLINKGKIKNSYIKQLVN